MIFSGSKPSERVNSFSISSLLRPGRLSNVHIWHPNLLEGRCVRIRSLDCSACSIARDHRVSPTKKTAEALEPDDFHNLLTFLDYPSVMKEIFGAWADLSIMS